MLIDTHAHLDFEGLYEDLAGVLKRATETNVKRIITIGCNIGSSKKALEISQKNEVVYAAVGIHPCDILEDEETTKQLLQLEQLVAEAGAKLLAIGEIGLDYYWMNSPISRQKEMLELQLELAKRYDLPVIIHARNSKAGDFDASSDCLGILKRHEIRKAVFHCFSGKLEFAQRVWEEGYFTSFTGIVTYPKSEELRRIIISAPQDRIMIETDAPFLAPQQWRGQRNEPAYVCAVANLIAKLKGWSVDEAERILETNTRNFFERLTGD